MRPRRPPGRLAPVPLGRPGWCLRFPVEAAQGPGPPTQAPPGHPGRLPRARPSGRCAGAVSVCGLVRNSRRLVSAAASCWPPARAGCGRARGRGQPPGVPPRFGPWGPCPSRPCRPPRWARSALSSGVWPPALRPQGGPPSPPCGEVAAAGPALPARACPGLAPAPCPPPPPGAGEPCQAGYIRLAGRLCSQAKGCGVRLPAQTGAELQRRFDGQAMPADSPPCPPQGGTIPGRRCRPPFQCGCMISRQSRTAPRRQRG